jgi:hypothetical protein
MTSSRRSQIKSFWGSTFVKLKKTKFLLFLSKSRHRRIPLPLVILLYNCHYVIVHCAFTLHEFIKTLECITPLCISLDPIMVEIH